jgi:hypothetical protein
MGKEKGNMINGLPCKKRRCFIEVRGPIKLHILRKMYPRVAYRLPVVPNLSYQKENEFYKISKKLKKLVNDKYSIYCK